MGFRFAEKIKIGIIGVGHLGRFHLKNFLEIDDCEVIGIYDIDEKKLQKISQEYSVKSYDDLDTLLKDVDAVSVVTPTSTHFDITKKALEQKIHTFIEKPITENLSQAEEIMRIGKEKNLKIQVGHIERFNPAFLGLKGMNLNPRFIESHRLAEFNPRGTDVSVILDLMIHDLDIILKIVNSRVQSIEANGVGVITDSIDIANARVKFLNDTVANLTASRISTKNMRKMRIFQKNAYISVDFLEKKSEIFSVNSLNNLPDINFTPIDEFKYSGKKQKLLYASHSAPESNAMKIELTEFVNSILRDETPPVTAEDGYRNLETAFAILEKINK